MKKINKLLNLSINSTKNLYKIIDKNEYEFLCNIFTKFLDVTKN